MKKKKAECFIKYKFYFNTAILMSLLITMLTTTNYAVAQTWKQAIDSSTISQRHLVLCISRDSIPDTVFNYISSKLTSQDTILTFLQNNIVISTSDSIRRVVLLDSLVGYNGISYVGNFYSYLGESNFYIGDELAVILPDRADSAAIGSWLSSKGYKINKSLGENEYFSTYYAISQSALSIFTTVDSIALLWGGDSVVVSPNFIYSIAQFSDPNYGNQWGVYNTGSGPYGGINDADGDVQEAWDITNGCSDIKVAILDDGVDLQHEDISANLVQGHTAFSVYDDPAYGNRDGDISREPFPHHGNYTVDIHGTECAGVVGAVKDNGFGIVGVANGCKIMPIKVGHTDLYSIGSKSSYYTISAFYDGIVWAADHGADVISLSIQFVINDDIVKKGILYAKEHGRKGLGCSIVISSGNDNSTKEYFPAGYNQPNTDFNDFLFIAGGSNQCDSRWRNGACGYSVNYSGSNFGNTLDFVAPAQDIFTTDRMGSRKYSYNNVEYDDEGNYTLQSGTSFSAPYIAGIIALIYSCQPTLKPAEVKKIIASTCDKVGGYTYSTVSGHPYGIWNNEMGYGRVNARAAVEQAATLYFDDYLWLYNHLNYFAKKKIIAGDGVRPTGSHGPVPIYLSATPTTDITFRAGEEVALLPGFEVIGDAQPNVGFSAYIDNDCALYDGVIGGIVGGGSGSAKASSPIAEKGYSPGRVETALSVYPNPVISIIDIQYSIASSGIAQIDIVNLYGQSISTVVYGEQPQGKHTVKFNTQDLPNGVYFVQFRSQSGMISKPMIVRH